MGRTIFIQVLILLLVILSGCNIFGTKNSLPIEMVAFNSLIDEEKELISVSPKDSIVEKISINDEVKPFIDSDYDKAKVYSVTFNHTENDSSGKLTVFVDLDKATVIGKGFITK